MVLELPKFDLEAYIGNYQGILLNVIIYGDRIELRVQEKPD